ncbi:hypothetical protein ES703_26094 [subsurface metagenome]
MKWKDVRWILFGIVIAVLIRILLIVACGGAEVK